MAITEVTEKWAGRTGDLDDEYKRTYKRLFTVYSDDALDGPSLILQAAGIPQIWDPFADEAGNSDDLALCKKLSVDADEEPGLWHVTADYSSDAADEGKQAEDPLERPAEISFGSETIQKALTKCTRIDDGGAELAEEALVNSAGEQFDPPVTIDIALPVLQITRNEAAFDFARAQQYGNKTNSVLWKGCEPGTVLCNPIRATSAFENNVSFWRVEYRFIYNPEGWDLNLLDAGYHYLKDGAELVKAMDPNSGGPMASPILLDGHGNQNPVGAPPVYLVFRPRERIDLNELGLPG